MSEFDRLSSLINRFSLKVTPQQGVQVNLVIMGDIKTQVPTKILLAPLSFLGNVTLVDDYIMFSAGADWGGRDNPLLATLPNLIEINIPVSYTHLRAHET